MVVNCTIKTRPRRAFGKRPPAPRKPEGKPGWPFAGARGGGSELLVRASVVRIIKGAEAQETGPVGDPVLICRVAVLSVASKHESALNQRDEDARGFLSKNPVVPR